MNLNERTWEWFEFDKIFDIKKGFYNKKPESSGNGTIPFLGATDSNNGVTEFYTLEEIEMSSKTGDLPNEPLAKKMFPKNAVCVTNNGSVGYAYFQNRDFTCSHDVNPLYRKDGEFNEYTGWFISTVIMKDRYRWGYGRKWRPDRMKKSRLKLPITQDENGNALIDRKKVYSLEGFVPDWEWMEKYVKSLHYKTLTTGITKSELFLRVDEWKPFKVKDLLSEIYKANSYNDSDLEKVEAKKSGTLPYITRTEDNNSCKSFVHADSTYQIEKGNAIVVGDTTSTISYQPDDFIAGEHVVVLRFPELNKYTGLFLVSILKKERFRYSYGRAFNKDLIEETEIKLPSIGDNPDWEWMENYIRHLPYSDRI